MQRRINVRKQGLTPFLEEHCPNFWETLKTQGLGHKKRAKTSPFLLDFCYEPFLFQLVTGTAFIRI